MSLSAPCVIDIMKEESPVEAGLAPSFWLRENGNAGRIAVEKIPPAHRPHFSLRKKSGQRNGAQLFPQDAGVVMRDAEEPFAAPAATEQQRAERC